MLIIMGHGSEASELSHEIGPMKIEVVSEGGGDEIYRNRNGYEAINILAADLSFGNDAL